MNDSATSVLARFVANLTYERIPADAIAMAKNLVLDTLGTAFAASRIGEGCAAVVEVMRARAGRPESTVLGFDGRISVLDAAFANGALAHALNYDAYGHESGHVGVAALTAPLAVAEARGPIDGRRFLTAVVAAAEVNARVTAGAMRGKRRTREHTQAGQAFAYFAAAAGAASILGLSAELVHDAFGVAVMQIAGSRQLIIEGDAPAKAIYGAFPNQGGVLAALLAEAGLVARVDALGGKAGFYALTTGGDYDSDALLAGLGTEWRFLDVQFKPWPTSAVVAPFIEAALVLRREHDLSAEDIAAISVAGSRHVRAWFEPLAERRRPANGAAAANSVPYAVAKAFVHGNVALSDFTPAGLNDEPVLRLTALSSTAYDDAVQGGCVTVRTRSGRELSASIDKALGDPSRPLSRERLEEKFADCCATSLLPNTVNPMRIVEFVARLEEQRDATRFARPADDADFV